MNIWTVFLTGLLTGGLTCLAVQGGLLATSVAQREQRRLEEKIHSGDPDHIGHALPILFFLIAKLAAYTMLGFLLGWFGSLFQLSLTAKVIMQFFVGIFMIGTALSLLDVHPVFRYFIIQPPKFLTRMVRKESKSTEFFSPALLGAFTVFIPCGTTQAMMALAIASGSAVAGATILSVFVLGTSPVFFILGYFATRLGSLLHAKFMTLAAFAILLLAVFNINSAAALSGSSVTLETVWHGMYCGFFSICEDSPLYKRPGQVAAATAPVNEATVTIHSSGYNPDKLIVKAGSRVTLHLVNTNGGGCIQAFTIPKLGIEKVIRQGTSDTIQFLAPPTAGKLAFMCSMGMYRGEIEVI